MKIFYLLLFLTAIFSANLQAQKTPDAYYDAIELRTQAKLDISAVDVGKVAEVLSRYLPDSLVDKASAENTITNFKKNNPFFDSFFNAERTAQGNGTSFFSSSVKSLANLGALDVTSIADGLAQFLIKRGKEELNIAFFQRMKDFLDSNVEAKTLFPATSAFLKKIESYRYAELLQSLREAFYTDINNLIVNLNLLIDLPKYQDLLKALPEIRVAVRCAKIVSELSQGDAAAIHPADLIHQFAEIKEWGEMNINLQGSLLMLDRISESVRKMDSSNTEITTTYTTSKDSFTLVKKTLSENVASLEKIKIDSGKTIMVTSIIPKLISSPNEAWIKFKDFHNNILSDDTTLKIYLGLLYQRMEGITFRNTKSEETNVQQFMRDNSDDALKIVDFIENFLVLANDVDKSVKEIREKKNELTKDDYYTYIEKAINITAYGFKVANFIQPDIVNDRYIVIAKNANELYKNIYTKNYNAAVMSSYTILKQVLTSTDVAIAEKNNYFNTLKSTSNLNGIHSNILKDTLVFKASVATLNNEGFMNNKSAGSRYETVERILRYGNLIASIVKAESAQEAEAAIEAAVLPAGSSSIKKNASWNISLNAYIGGYFARSSNSTDAIDGNNSSVGVTAPVGIAFSKGLWRFNNGRSSGSISLYGTLIDVGAIAGYRLNDDSTALNQKITLNDIFTPGGFIVYGLGLPFKWASYIPLSIGYGWQYGSKLYYKKADNTLGISDKSRWRSNWFVAIDIPLANFWTKNYDLKNK